MYEYRKVPSRKLKQRLDVLKFKDEGPLKEYPFTPRVVRIALHEHLGAPARPAVGVGAKVRRGDLIGEGNGAVSSNVHASIDGIVREVTRDVIVLERMES
jgi:Na+-translocating ferredoxin:NAD+ oxidoreductase RnfC subunit